MILEIPCCILFFLKCHSEVCEREGCGTLTLMFRVYALRVEMKPQVFRCLSLTDAKFIRLAYSWHKPHSLGEHRLFMSVQDRDTKTPVSWTKSRMLLWMSLCRCVMFFPKKLTLFEIHTTVITEGISVTKVHSKSPFPSLSRSFSLSFSSVVAQSNTVSLEERSLGYSQAYIKLIHGLRQAVQLPPL